MYVKNSPDQWAEMLEKFNSYDGSVTNFCEENKISKSQFYYHRKRKVQQPVVSTFCEVELVKVTTPITTKEVDTPSSYIKIEINNVTIHIPPSEAALLTTIIKELSNSC